MLTKERLLKYCEQNKINVPSKASVEFLNAAIVRAAFHNQNFELKEDKCFGFWEHEDTTCMTCDHEKTCFKASIGMEKEEYFKKQNAMDGQRVRMVKKMR